MKITNKSARSCQNMVCLFRKDASVFRGGCKDSGRFKYRSLCSEGTIHAGGRGKGGESKYQMELRLSVKMLRHIRNAAVTHQTGPDGQKVKQLLIEEGRKSAKLYCSVSRPSKAAYCASCIHGRGMDIEEVAANLRIKY